VSKTPISLAALLLVVVLAYALGKGTDKPARGMHRGHPSTHGADGGGPRVPATAE